MKLLHVITSVDPAGGGPIEGVKQFHTALAALGHTTEAVSLDVPGESFLIDAPLPVHPLGTTHLSYGYSRRLVPWLRANASKYDAVIVNGLWQYGSLGTWCALADGQVPYFIFPHGMLDPWFKRQYPLKHLKKWLYWPWAEYRVLRDAAAVIFTCEEERLLARESFWLYRANEVVANYGTAAPPTKSDELIGTFLDAFPECRDRRLLLFLSRIHKKKGCDLLIEAFAQVASEHPALHLVMAGPDQTGWLKELKAQASQLGLNGRVTWAGMLQGDRKWGAFHACEGFCLPSHQENFGIVVAEALGCGKPVLISNMVNIWREIEADDAGFVDSDDLDGTVRNLRRFLGTAADDRSAMSRRAIDCFERRFSMHKAASRLVEIIEDNRGNHRGQ